VSNIDHCLGDSGWQIASMPLREFQADLGPQRYGIDHLVEKDHCREVRGETSFDELPLRLAHYLGMRIGWMLTC
jgi:hypothetical protein